MGRVRITARFYGPRLMRRAHRYPAEAQRMLDKALENSAEQAVTNFQTHAPELTRRLKRGITARPTATGFTVSVEAVDPETGYDYVGVTRFGHRVRRIRPVAGHTKSGKRVFRDGMLRFPLGGRILYRRSVRGYRPKGDWVVPARVETHEFARQEMKRVGAEIARMWG